MKNASTILSALALVGVLILFGMQFSGNKDTKRKNTTIPAATGSVPTRIAYIDIDTFEANYEYLKAKRADFTKRQESMQAELERSAAQLRANAQEFQQKVQSGNISQSEGESTQKKLMQMDKSLQLREQSLTEQLLKEKNDFNDKLHESLDDFLAEYNKDGRYDYIFSYSRVGSQILFANKALDITDDVIKGMNERAKNISDSTKKK